MGLTFTITNLDRLEAQLVAGLGKYTNDLMTEVKSELEKFRDAVIRRVATHEDFMRLKTDEILRGQLGMATPDKRVGGDTDAEDLLKVLQEATVTEQRHGKSRRMILRFPSIAELSDRLEHLLTRIQGGQPIPGPRKSWFAWWEFGNAGDYSGATVFKFSTFRSKAKFNLQQKITELSRSGQAIQFPNSPTNAKSVIPPHKVLQTTYSNFGRILPARMGIILRGFARASDINTYFRNV